MKKKFVILIMATLFSLASTKHVRAGIYSLAHVGYEPELGSMRAFVGTYADYDTSLYYCTEAYGYIFEDGVEIGDVYASDIGGGGYQACVGIAREEAYFPYDPNAEYDIESFHEADVILQQSLGWYDTYNYIEYTYGLPVLFPNNFSFVGLGPPQVSSVRDILLGNLTGAFIAGAVAGQPHHLKLVSDTYPTSSCGSVRRHLKFRVVDSAGRRTGRVQVEETFETASQPATGLQSVYNSCQNSNHSPLGCAQVDADNTFTDQLWVGCPSAGGDCGFPTVTSRWWWCARGVGRVSLTSNTYEVRHNQALVNGSAGPFAAGTEFR
ncbi:MAG: hypothetical protein H0T60_16910 [Acidobacteria bacterium]|nr:hypothetical protein [Acidobacteriota bacterium]